MLDAIEIVRKFVKERGIQYAGGVGIEISILSVINDPDKRKEIEKCIKDLTNDAEKVYCIFRVAGIVHKWSELIENTLNRICSDYCFRALGLDEDFDDECHAIDKILDKCEYRCMKKIKRIKHIYRKIKSSCNNDKCVDVVIDIITNGKHNLLRTLLNYVKDFDVGD
jgi:sugar-specific transcriptional regulator TrmB